MPFFTQSQFDARLYLGEQQPNDGGHVYLVATGKATKDGYDLPTALFDPVLAATIVFSPLLAKVDSGEAAKAFVDAVLSVVEGYRAYLWLRDPDPAVFAKDLNESAILGIAANGGAVSFGMARATIIPNILSLRVPSGMKISLPEDSTTVVFTGSQGTEIGFDFTGAGQLDDQPALSGQLPFSGPFRGVVQWDTFIPRLNLHDQLFWGFQFLFPVDQEVRSAIYEWLPLASGTDPVNQNSPFAFHATVDPVDPFNLLLANPARTALTFTGKYQDGQEAVLDSFYRTVFGDLVQLRPVGDAAAGEQARLVFSLGEKTDGGAYSYAAGPEGDFLLGAPEAAGEVTDLLAGLQGTEYISFRSRPQPGSEDRLRFRSRQAALAPAFPFPKASPTGPPVKPNAPLLTDAYMTSWATVMQADESGSHYVAQPKGASLFGRDDSRATGDSPLALLWPSDIGVALPKDKFFPMPPYSAVVPGDGVVTFSKDQIEQFERQVVSPTRRTQIGATPTSFSKRATLFKETSDGSTPLTTPSGVIALVTTSGSTTTWDSIRLGQNDLPEGGQMEMEFVQPSPELQQVFQTNSLFLVAGNACHLGKLTAYAGLSCPQPNEQWCPGFEQSAGAFKNEINIEEWKLAANVGVRNHYNDYRNVLIVKGRKGKLWDPTEKADGLVQNPDLWTQRGEFASPSYLSPKAGEDGSTQTEEDVEYTFECPDANQQVILSQWLDGYFRAASRETGEYFRRFNEIALDENWTGILVLRADITQLPKDLVGILAGVRDLDSFNAHHFGVNITPVDGKSVSTDKPSSIFGLIHYQDPDYDPERADTPVQPTAGQTYDFITLTLNVLFENSAVRDFESMTQLTLNVLFDQQVSEMGGEGGNRYNTVILRGTFQKNGDQTVYSMGSQSDDLFLFDSNALEEVEVNRVQMSTRDSSGEEVVIWFAMSGFLSFGVVRYVDLDCPAEPPTAMAAQQAIEPMESFDIFSFGAPEGENPTPRQGLSYSNLGLRMTFMPPPAGETDPPKKSFEPVIDEMFFNVDTSTPRGGSLFLDFALELGGIVKGGKEATPSSEGYLPVTTAAPLQGVDGSDWYGLRYKLDLGSPGKLAGKAGLNSYLLVAWSPQSSGGNYKATVAIQLPGTGGGAKLISLQNVLKLSIGNIWLNRAFLPPPGNGGETTERAWLLLFSEIALKFLGLLKIPPGGTSTFYLYGDPKSGGKPSGLGWYAIYKTDGGKASTACAGEEN